MELTLEVLFNRNVIDGLFNLIICIYLCIFVFAPLSFSLITKALPLPNFQQLLLFQYYGINFFFTKN